MPRLTAETLSGTFLLELQRDADLPVGLRSMWFEFLSGSPFDAMPEVRGRDSVAVGQSGHFRRLLRSDRLEIVLKGHVNGNGSMDVFRERMQDLQAAFIDDTDERVRNFTLTMHADVCGDNEALLEGETASIVARWVRTLPSPRSKPWLWQAVITLESVARPPMWTFDLGSS